MSSYQIAPYLFRVKTRGQGAAASKALSNIDGSGTSLESAVGNVLASMLQRTTDYQDLQDPNKLYQLSRVRAEQGKAYFLTIEPGRKGLQSTLRQGGSVLVSRSVGDVEYVELRHLIYFPPNGHTALVFAERHGRYGAITFLRACLHQVLTEKFGALTVELPPLTTLETLESASFNRIVFQAPKKKDSSGRLIDWGPKFRIDIGFQAGRSFRDFLNPLKKIDTSKVFGILTDEVGDAGLGAPQDATDWEANLSVTMPDGRTRTFKVGGDGPALLYPLNGAMVNGNLVSPTAYPTDDEFLGVCESILEDLAGKFDIQPGQKLPKESKLKPWDGSQSNPWEVTYYDSP